MGLYTYQCFMKMGIEQKVIGFVETYSSRERKVQNIAVRGIDDIALEIKEKDDSLVIIAVQNKYQKEIIGKLDEIGISKYITIDTKVLKKWE